MPSDVSPLKLWQFREPRRGCRLEDCQDAIAGDPFAGRFAIADGASESYSPALWADLLVRSHVADEQPETTWDYRLGDLRELWYLQVNGTEDTDALPYYLEDRYRRGAFATFLGLTIDVDDAEVDEDDTPQPPFAWHAFAVGDSCLFQVREGELLEAFPYQSSETFRDAPWLVGSRWAGEANDESEQRCEGTIDSHDRLWLMTDALAAWFLHEVELGRQPWQELETLLATRLPSRAFREWIHENRDSHRIKDDDVTLMIVYPSLESD